MTGREPPSGGMDECPPSLGDSPKAVGLLRKQTPRSPRPLLVVESRRVGGEIEEQAETEQPKGCDRDHRRLAS